MGGYVPVCVCVCVCLLCACFGGRNSRNCGCAKRVMNLKNEKGDYVVRRGEIMQSASNTQYNNAHTQLEEGTQKEEEKRIDEWCILVERHFQF